MLKQSLKWAAGIMDFLEGCLVSASRGIIAFAALGNKLFLSLFVSDAIILNCFSDGSGTNSAQVIIM